MTYTRINCSECDAVFDWEIGPKPQLCENCLQESCQPAPRTESKPAAITPKQVAQKTATAIGVVIDLTANACDPKMIPELNKVLGINPPMRKGNWGTQLLIVSPRQYLDLVVWLNHADAEVNQSRHRRMKNVFSSPFFCGSGTQP